MPEGHIYALVDAEGNPRYVGMTTRTPRKRLAKHLRDAGELGHGTPLVILGDVVVRPGGMVSWKYPEDGVFLEVS